MTNNYKHELNIHNPESAEVVLPEVIKLINPQNIVDVGCGLGDWLYTASKYGITDYLGIDGIEFDKGKMYITQDHFITANLEKPLDIEKKFDLAICLEVAEHLPSSSAPNLVNTLVKLSDNILFSAAIPGQGGQNHVNEQSYSYWEDLFAVHNYKFYDVLRHKIWCNKKVYWWYQQNIFLVSKKEYAYNYFIIDKINTYIHPELFYKKQRMFNKIIEGKESPRRYLHLFFKSIKLYLKSKFH